MAEKEDSDVIQHAHTPRGHGEPSFFVNIGIYLLLLLTTLLMALPITQVGCREHPHLLPHGKTLRGRQGVFQGTNTRCGLGTTSSSHEVDRRQLLREGAALCGSLLLARQLPAGAAVDAGAATTVNKLLCEGDCLTNLDAVETHETKSGLKYKDIVVGKGPSPPTGYQAGSGAHIAAAGHGEVTPDDGSMQHLYATSLLPCLHVQVTCNYVAMTPNGRVFDSSLDRGFPYDIRVGAGQVPATCCLCCLGCAPCPLVARCSTLVPGDRRLAASWIMH